MNKLLKANFLRLWKNVTFWNANLIMFALGIILVFYKYSNMTLYDIDRFIYNDLMDYVIFVGCCLTVFCSMFLGTEYSDGTIRNKLIAGHLRISIYMANWLTNVAAAFIMVAAFLFPYCSFGSFLLKTSAAPLGMSLGQVFHCLFISIFTVIAFVSLYTMLVMLMKRKASSAALCILLFFGLFLISANIEERLRAPEFIPPAYSMVIDGVEQEQDEEPNPKYLQPDERKVFQFFADMIPTGQCLQLTSYDVLHPFLLIVYATAMSVIMTGFGIFVFQKKNL